ncbi:MAG: hypothetical protein ACKOX3_03900 [Bacteroidota bacterium]
MSTNSNNNSFALVYPKFRLLNIVCIGYWMILMAILLTRNELELVDELSYLLYATFILAHLIILTATFITDKLNKGQKLIFNLAILPLNFSIIALLVSIISYGSVFLEKLID